MGTNGVSYDDLELSGGFYTNCSNDIYGIYGSITHTYQEENHETKTYKLNAGIAYNMPENKMKSEGLQCNFQRLNNQYPFGYVYDENGHIGFVGAKIKNNENQDAQQVNNAINCAIEQANTCISNLFYYENGEVAYKR